MPINNKFNFKPTDELFKIRYLNFIVGSSVNDCFNVIDLDYFTVNVSPLIGAFSDLVKQSPFHDIPSELIARLGMVDNNYRLFIFFTAQYNHQSYLAAMNRINAYRRSWSNLKIEARKIADNLQLPESVVKECFNESIIRIEWD